MPTPRRPRWARPYGGLEALEDAFYRVFGYAYTRYAPKGRTCRICGVEGCQLVGNWRSVHHAAHLAEHQTRLADMKCGCGHDLKKLRTSTILVHFRDCHFYTALSDGGQQKVELLRHEVLCLPRDDKMNDGENEKLLQKGGIGTNMLRTMGGEQTERNGEAVADNEGGEKKSQSPAELDFGNRFDVGTDVELDAAKASKSSQLGGEVGDTLTQNKLADAFHAGVAEADRGRIKKRTAGGNDDDGKPDLKRAKMHG
jgi:hypothetical protein